MIKNFVKYIFLSIFLLQVPKALAAEEHVPTQEEYIAKEAPFLGQLLYLYNYYAEIDKKYPGAALDSADLTPIVREMYPAAAPQEVYDKADSIKGRLRAYRYFKNLYNKIMADMLVPEPPPLIVEDADIDSKDVGDYIDSPELVVINDFKKVLSYSYDKRDIEAIEAKIEREKAQDNSHFGQLKQHVKKLEWRKLPFYGLVYDDPFTGRDGIGAWQEKDGLKARLLAADSALGTKAKLKAGIELKLPKDKFIWAQEGKSHTKPQIDFLASENLADAKIYWPLPTRLYHGEADYTAYAKSLLIPIELEAADKNKPLKLKAHLQTELCDFSSCLPTKLDLELTLASGVAEPSAVNNYITTEFNLLPPKTDDDIKIQSVVVDIPQEKNSPEVLRVTIDIDTSLSEFSIFAETAEKIELSAPKITIDGRRIVARFYAKDPAAKLSGKDFTITAKLGKFNSLRNTYTAQSASGFDTLRPVLSLGLVLLALLGGFLLNFMPCVFPALSLKLMGLSAFGGSNESRVKRSFALSALGIYIGFALIILLLCLLKFIGMSIGWGMQFQNPLFLVFMMLVLVLFITQIKGITRLSLPPKLQKQSTRQENLFWLCGGIFVVLLSTPCTAPYLGTVVGFALAGSYLDIVIILSAVALGLSLPYLLICLWPDVVLLMPKPGAWQQKLERLMLGLLLITLLWLLSVFASQSGIWAAVRQSLYLLVIWFVLWFRRQTYDKLEDIPETTENKSKARRFLARLFICILGLFVLLSGADAAFSFRKHQQITAQTTSTELQYDYIKNQVAAGKTVFVTIGADWCLTCRYNEFTVLNNDAVKGYIQRLNVELIEIDWTDYNQEVLDFMEKFGRKGLPFYVIFSPKVPDGLVLPEILTEKDLNDILREAV